MNTYEKKCARLAVSSVLLLAMFTVEAVAQGPEKPKDRYQTFYLTNATSRNAANDISTAMRNVMPGAKIYYAETENALLISGTEEDVAQARKILTDLDKPQKVYRVTYTISDEHGAPMHLAMLVSRGRRATTKQGTRVPIMTGSYKEGGGETANTQFQYQDIGLNIDASLEGYGEGLRLMSKIEETRISEQKSNVGIQDPIVDQTVLETQSTVNSVKPVSLGSLDMPDGKHIDVQVTIAAVE